MFFLLRFFCCRVVFRLLVPVVSCNVVIRYIVLCWVVFIDSYKSYYSFSLFRQNKSVINIDVYEAGVLNILKYCIEI